MGKKKSAVFLILITIVIAVLCVACTVSFPFGIKNYHSVISIIPKDAELGGGYTAVYYPEGVISAEEYESTLGGYADEEKRAEYADKYSAHDGGAVYFEKEKVFGDGDGVSEDFKKSFENNVQAVRERFERKRIAGARVEVRDDYTVLVTVPELSETVGTAISLFASAGEVTVAYGSTDSKIIETTTRNTVNDYIKGAYSRTVQGTSYVAVEFTKEGRELIKKATAGAADSSSTMYFMVGDTTLINLTVSEQIDQSTLYISGSYTSDTAETVAILFDSALNGVQTDLSMSAGDLQQYSAGFGENTMTFVYIAFGAFMAVMAVFFLVRYRRLGFAHIYSYLAYFLSMVLCLAFIPFLYLSTGTLAAVAITSVLLCVSNVVTYEYVRKEYALGKTMTSSVKTGYKKCFWHIFDLHIAVALIAFIAYFIALTELRAFAFVLGLGAVFSGVCSLAVSRFCWAIMMAFSKDKGAFCHFRREEVDDE